MEAIRQSPTREQTAVRLLFVIDRLGDPFSGNNGVRVVRSQVRLQKLDFLMRNPDYLICELVASVRAGRLAPERLLDAKRIVDSEPRLHTYRMLRNRFGACEPLDDALALLYFPGLVRVHRSGSPTDAAVRRRDYIITDDGIEKAEDLRRTYPELGWYDRQAEFVSLVASGQTGEQLRQRQYQYEEYSSSALGTVIGGVWSRANASLEAALDEYGVDA